MDLAKFTAKKVVVTGCAGFIGAAVCQALLAHDITVIGIDNLNDYYDVQFKQARLNHLLVSPHFHFYQQNISDEAALLAIFAKHKPNRVIHLAAQAGVRYSLENPQAYVDSNLKGFVTIIEACRQLAVEHLVYASSSSVYGSNQKFPYSVMDNVDHPVSLYAATKKSNELIAHAYSHLYQLPVTGLRYFTVYGPWGRPDMSPFKFVSAILKGEPIDVFNHGQHQRDSTYIDDIVQGTILVSEKIPVVDAQHDTPYRLYNIGFGKPRELLHFIQLIETALGRYAEKNFLPKQPGDVDVTWADTTELVNAIDFRPQISLEQGVPQFVSWYKNFYRG